MSDDATALYAAKRAQRRALQAKPIAEKLRMLDQLRQRAQTLQRTGQAAPPVLRDVSDVSYGAPQMTNESRRLGGRAAAAGTGYEQRVATFVAVKMLVGSHAGIWEGITGDRIAEISMQTADTVDDIRVRLHDEPYARVYISAKERGNTISISRRSGPFKETIESFVRQYLALDSSSRETSRMVWAVPSCVGRKLTHVLPTLLHALRLNASGTPFADFEANKMANERAVLTPLLAVVRQTWNHVAGCAPTDAELGELLCHVYVEQYDFDCGNHSERAACSELRQYVLANPAQAEQAWQAIQQIFSHVDEHGLTVTVQSLRRKLVEHNFVLQSPPDYAADIAKLDQLTQSSLERLQPHATLRLGQRSQHVARTAAVAALRKALQANSLLVTGAPGCGKSGLLHALVTALQAEGTSVVLLLAEDTTELDQLGHPLAEVLANWQDNAGGVLVLDAVDAIREPVRLAALHKMLRRVLNPQTTWKVVASVREFDARHNRSLRELFAGTSVPGYSLPDLQGVAHLHVSGFTDEEMKQLGGVYPELQPLLAQALQDVRVAELYRSPFNLSLVCDLLTHGAPPARIAEWSNPALLFRKYWEMRNCGTHMDALRLICETMVARRCMSVSLKQLAGDKAVRDSIAALRSAGILESPRLVYGVPVGEDRICFTHHVLHDYAIARALIPEIAHFLCEYIAHDRYFPILYRQSYLYALEELWDNDRASFWQAALELEGRTEVPAITRLVAPVVAARLSSSLADLQGLLSKIGGALDYNAPPQRALRHLVAGLTDMPVTLIAANAALWCYVAQKLAVLLPQNKHVAWEMTQLIRRLVDAGATTNAGCACALNAAARALLQNYMAQEPADRARATVEAAVKAICLTFEAAPAESENQLLAVLASERMPSFPHDDLRALADNIKNLGLAADAVVLRLFEAAFAEEPTRGEQEQCGTPIMGLLFDKADLWTISRHVLAEYYIKRANAAPDFMTAAACIAWNSVERRRARHLGQARQPLQSITFHGIACELADDMSFISGRGSEHDENKILTHYEQLLRQWASANAPAQLDALLRTFAEYNHTSLMWSLLMAIGAEHPNSLGHLLESLLLEPVILAHPDYRQGSTALLAALHHGGDAAQRRHLEQIVLDFPNRFQAWSVENHLPAPEPEDVQNRLLKALDERDLVTNSLRDLKASRHASGQLDLPGEIAFKHLSGDELAALRGQRSRPHDPAIVNLGRLQDALNPLLDRDGPSPSAAQFDEHWRCIEDAEKGVTEHLALHRGTPRELWCTLVSACATSVFSVNWPPDDPRWQVIRRILLTAAADPLPSADDGAKADSEHLFYYASPAPRVDAARALPQLAEHLGCAEDEVAAALSKLAEDKNYVVRYQLALHMGRLAVVAQQLMWQLCDALIAGNSSFHVLDALARMLQTMLAAHKEEAMARLEVIGERACTSAPAQHRIHETLADIYLLYFLRTGNEQCKAYIQRLIAECDTEHGATALHRIVQTCRTEQYFTCGDTEHPDPNADRIRESCWAIIGQLMNALQAKLKELRQRESTGHTPSAEQSNCYNRLALLADDVAMQLSFVSGVHKSGEASLSNAQLRRLWREGKAVLEKLAEEPHPHTAHTLLQILLVLLPCAPEHVFLLAAKTIRHSKTVGFNLYYEAADIAVRIFEQALTSHPEIFLRVNDHESPCMIALVDTLDLFVDAGWEIARRIAYQLERVYR